MLAAPLGLSPEPPLIFELDASPTHGWGALCPALGSFSLSRLSRPPSWPQPTRPPPTRRCAWSCWRSRTSWPLSKTRSAAGTSFSWATARASSSASTAAALPRRTAASPHRGGVARRHCAPGVDPAPHHKHANARSLSFLLFSISLSRYFYVTTSKSATDSLCFLSLFPSFLYLFGSIAESTLNFGFA